MLIRTPKEFERVATEWAVKYAGAPKRERGETSGGATAETLKTRQRKSKEQEEAERVAQYVHACDCFSVTLILSPGTVATMKGWWITLSAWASIGIGSWPPLTLLVSTRTTANTTIWRRHMLEISWQGCLVRLDDRRRHMRFNVFYLASGAEMHFSVNGRKMLWSQGLQELGNRTSLLGGNQG